MHCYLCTNKTDLIIKNNLGYDYCFMCKVIYVKKSELSNFFSAYVANNFTKIKNFTDLKEDLNLNLYENKFKIKGDFYCFNTCRENCSLVQYKYKNLRFYYCNFTEYYVFTKDNLNKFVQRCIRLNYIKYYINYIRNRVKTLFIKEG